MTLKRRITEVGEQIKRGGRWVNEKIETARRFVKDPKNRALYKEAIAAAKTVKPLAKHAGDLEKSVSKYGKKADKAAGRVAAVSRTASSFGDSVSKGDVRGAFKGAQKIAAISSSKDKNPRPKKKMKK